MLGLGAAVNVKKKKPSEYAAPPQPVNARRTVDDDLRKTVDDHQRVHRP